MSLFRAREFWSTQCGVDEEHDVCSLAIGNVDNSPDASMKIVVGSFGGYVRVFAPHAMGFAADDLLMEINLLAPVLGIAIGKFHSFAPALGAQSSYQLQQQQQQQQPVAVSLAVLHPKSLAVYLVSPAKGTSHASGTLTHTLLFEHAFPRGCFNMTYGPMGLGTAAKDRIAVQSLDGIITVVDGESVLFSRFLPHILIPGPMAYVQRTDSIVVANSIGEIVAFRFHALASMKEEPSAASQSSAASSGSGEGKSSSNSIIGTEEKGRTAAPDWKFNMGEAGVAVIPTRISAPNSGPASNTASSLGGELVVLSERSLMVLSEQGNIKSQKKLDYFPSCMVAYPAPSQTSATHNAPSAPLISSSQSNNNVLVASHTGMLMVYGDSGTKVLWAAKLPLSLNSFHSTEGEVKSEEGLASVPVAVAIGSFAGQGGLIVLLEDTGRLSLLYLGTDPATEPPVVVESKDLDYESMDKEHKRLQQLVKNKVADGAQGSRASKRSASAITLSIQVSDVSNGPSLDSLLLSKSTSSLSASSQKSSAGVGDADGNGDDHGDDGDEQVLRTAMLRVAVTYGGSEPLEGLVLSFRVPDGFLLVEESIAVPTIPPPVGNVPSTPLVFPVSIRAVPGRGIPATLEVAVRATYSLPGSGEPQSTESSATLPILMAAQCIPMSRAVANAGNQSSADSSDGSPASQAVSVYRFMVECDLESCPSMIDVYKDLSRVSDEVLRHVTSSSFAVQLFDSPLETCSVQTSKTGAKFRIQGSSLPAMAIVTQDLISRLSSGKQKKVLFSFSEPLPMKEYFEIIESHFASRSKLRQLDAQLGKLCHQLRAIQKRLLVRYKDKNPAPLLSMDLLLESSYEQIRVCAREVQKTQRDIQVWQSRVNSATNLVLLLAKLRFAIPEEDYVVLQQMMTPSTTGFVDMNAGEGVHDQGWEETVDAAMTHLLRTSLAKNAKEASSVPLPISFPSDTSRVTKHIALVLDRIAKGGHIALADSKDKPQPPSKPSGVRSSRGKSRADPPE
eukprot:ANDGO_05206.mRNA.1 hypothetical protein